MSEELYSKNYLEKTFEFLKKVKEASYQPFAEIENGTVIDVGCGTGQDAFVLANIFSNKHKIIGLDHNKTLIEDAQSKSEGIDNLEFIYSSAEKLPFQDAEISGLRNERLIQHLNNPQETYREFYRILRPGAPIVFLESDWRSLTFYKGDFELRHKFWDYMVNHRVADGRAVYRLADILENIGFNNISIEVFPIVSKDLIATSALIQFELALEEMIEKNFINQTDKLQFTEQLTKANELGSFAAAMNLVMIKANR